MTQQDVVFRVVSPVTSFRPLYTNTLLFLSATIPAGVTTLQDEQGWSGCSSWFIVVHMLQLLIVTDTVRSLEIVIPLLITIEMTKYSFSLSVDMMKRVMYVIIRQQWNYDRSVVV